MRGQGLVVVVLAVIAGVLAAPAGAEPTRVDRIPGDVIEGPRLSGENVFYGEVGRTRQVMRIVGPTIGRRKLTTLSGGSGGGGGSDEEESPGDYYQYSSNIAASPNWLAFKAVVSSGNARYQVGQSSLNLYGGTPTGDFARTDNCSNDNYYGPAAAALDIDGPRVASSDCNGAVVIRDHSTSPPTEKTFSAGSMLAVADLELAGPYLAYNAYPITPTGTSPTTTVVANWMTGATVYEIPRINSGNFDLQEDGATLAVSTGREDDLDCDEGKLAWYSAAEPTEHVLPVKPCSSVAEIHGGKIATILAGSSTEDRTAAIVGLDGARTDVAGLGVGLRRGTIDYDGTRVAYGLGNCLGGADIFTESATAPNLREEEPACPVRGLPKKDSLGPKNTQSYVNVECPRGCKGRVSISAKIDGKTRQIGSERVSIHPEDACLAKIHRVTLTRSARAALRERGSLLGRVTVSTNDRNGAPRSTSRGFRLRAASKNRGRPSGDCWI